MVPMPPPDATTALRVSMMPRDANVYGTIFGGVILSYIDQAGFIEARRHGTHRWVTVSIDRVDFTRPVHVGDVVTLRTWTIESGRTSLQIGVDVEAERYASGQAVTVTEARLTMVSVDAGGRPIPFSDPPSIEEPPAG